MEAQNELLRKQADGVKTFWKSLNDMRISGKLCDILLSVTRNDGSDVDYPAHKVILAASSEYFAANLEVLSTVTIHKLTEISELGLKAVLDVIYRQEIPRLIYDSPEVKQASLKLKISVPHSITSMTTEIQKPTLEPPVMSLYPDLALSLPQASFDRTDGLLHNVPQSSSFLGSLQSTSSYASQLFSDIPPTFRTDHQTILPNSKSPESLPVPTQGQTIDSMQPAPPNVTLVQQYMPRPQVRMHLQNPLAPVSGLALPFSTSVPHHIPFPISHPFINPREDQLPREPSNVETCPQISPLELPQPQASKPHQQEGDIHPQGTDMNPQGSDIHPHGNDIHPQGNNIPSQDTNPFPLVAVHPYPKESVQTFPQTTTPQEQPPQEHNSQALVPQSIETQTLKDADQREPHTNEPSSNDVEVTLCESNEPRGEHEKPITEEENGESHPESDKSKKSKSKSTRGKPNKSNMDDSSQTPHTAKEPVQKGSTEEVTNYDKESDDEAPYANLAVTKRGGLRKRKVKSKEEQPKEINADDKNKTTEPSKKVLRGGSTSMREKCSICGKLFTRSTILRHIWKVHQKGEPEKMRGRKKIYPYTRTEKHGDRLMIQCDQCNKLFSKENFRNHVARTHEKVRRSSCKICNKSFYDANNLKLHVETVHERKRPHQCGICDKYMARVYALQMHVSVQHGLKYATYKYLKDNDQLNDIRSQHFHKKKKQSRPQSTPKVREVIVPQQKNNEASNTHVSHNTSAVLSSIAGPSQGPIHTMIGPSSTAQPIQPQNVVNQTNQPTNQTLTSLLQVQNLVQPQNLVQSQNLIQTQNLVQPQNVSQPQNVVHHQNMAQPQHVAQSQQMSTQPQAVWHNLQPTQSGMQLIPQQPTQQYTDITNMQGMVSWNSTPQNTTQPTPQDSIQPPVIIPPISTPRPSVSNSTRLSCSLCKETFASNGTLSRHVARIHTQNNKKYACTFCNNKYFDSSALKNHIATHTGEKKHGCPMCSYRSIQKAQMISHIKNMHDDNKIKNQEKFLVDPDAATTFFCRAMGCKYKSKYKGNLKMHMLRKHGNEEETQEYKCSECSKVFRFRDDLHKHINRIHLRIKKFECEVCHRSCYDKWNLLKHKCKGKTREGEQQE